MGSLDQPDAAPGADYSRRLEKLASMLALAGGLLTVIAAILVTISVIGRRLFNSPIPADYELVSVCIGVAVFAFLSYTQARSGHIAVDTFTLKLPARVNAMIDGAWDLLLASFLGFFTWGLVTGAESARTNGETLMQLPWPIWPVYAVCAILCGFAFVVALAVAAIKIGGLK